MSKELRMRDAIRIKIGPQQVPGEHAHLLSECLASHQEGDPESKTVEEVLKRRKVRFGA